MPTPSAQHRKRGLGMRQCGACLLFGFGVSLIFLGDFSVEAVLCASRFTLLSPLVTSSALYSLSAIEIALLASLVPAAITKRRADTALASILALSLVCITFGDIERDAIVAGAIAVLFTFAGVALFIMWLEEATRYSSIWTKRCVIVSVLFEAIVKLLLPGLTADSAWVALIAYASSLALLRGALPLREILVSAARSRHCEVGLRPRFLVGFFSITACAYVALQAVTGSVEESDGLYGLGLVLTAAIMWRALATRAFPSYSALLKAAITLFVIAFALFPCVQAVDSARSLLALLSLTAGSSFWFGVVLFAADMCSHTKSGPIVVLAGVYAALSCQGLLGPLLSVTDPTWGGFIESSGACAVAVIMLTVSSLWLIPDRDLDDMLARSALAAHGAAAQVGTVACGTSAEAPAAPVGVEDSISPDSVIDGISERYGLTAKEREIIILYASGRSAPFIAEELALSVNTVKTHVANAYCKMGIHSRQELISLIDS